LGYNEIKAIAKSISRWVWKRDSYCYQEFIDRQTHKGRLGGQAKKAAYDSKRTQAFILKNKGLNNTQIAKELDVARMTVCRWFKGV